MEQIIGQIPPSMPAVSATTRPWGEQRQYAHNYPVTVSLMTVQPGRRLSLQSHPGRGELWIVIDDGAQVQVDDDKWLAKAGEEIWIPANGRHRLGAKDHPVRVVEVAFGNWQQDD
ncbi:MAG: phosphomannose isomerase type II C-terminal cupin domain, partial [Bifidobacteriaceae bacterium]|nr:phosphomannose isomerase type II C-terminal cupin domain [Bifidobacteriaceae bacterium]